MTPDASFPLQRRRWTAWVAAVCCLALFSLTWTAARADASTTIDERPDTELVSPADVDRVAPTPSGDRVILDYGTPLPEEGDPLVVPISAAAPEGVLGIVTNVQDVGDGRAAVETRPAPLGRAYSEIDLEDRTLAELTSGPSALTLLATQFDCTGSGKVDGPKIKPGLESLKLDLHIDPQKRAFRVVLEGQPKISVAISASGEAECRYTGHAGLPIVIPSTPILLTLSPAAHAKTSGAFTASFSWGPKIAIGVDSRKPGRAVHTISTPTSALPSFEGQVDASLFLGFSLSLSVAGRAGLRGTAGPEITADFTADNAAPCLTVTSSVSYHLSAFARFFFKNWDIPLKKGSFAVKPLWKKGNCEPPEGAVLAST